MNSTAHAKSVVSDADKASTMKDIHAKWDKITEAEGLALKSKDDLVTLVATKYGHGADRVKASAEVDAVLKGRAIG